MRGNPARGEPGPPRARPATVRAGRAEEADVDTVIVDGRILKRGGKVTGMSTTQVVADASTALAAIRKRAGDKLD